VIEEAKARLAEQYGISRGEAFELMLAISSHTNRKLRDVADRLVRGA
jgi:AmiR/NasT family two-component response regulator